MHDLYTYPPSPNHSWSEGGDYVSDPYPTTQTGSPVIPHIRVESSMTAIDAEGYAVQGIQVDFWPAKDNEDHYVTASPGSQYVPRWPQENGMLSASGIYSQSGGSASSGCPSPILPADQLEIPSQDNRSSPIAGPSTWSPWHEEVIQSVPVQNAVPLVPPPMREVMVMQHTIYPVSLDPEALWNRRRDYLQQLRHPNQTYYYKCSWPVGSGKCSAAFNVEDEAFGHVGDHIARAKYACSCGKTYTEERSAKRHQRTERVRFDNDPTVG